MCAWSSYPQSRSSSEASGRGRALYIMWERYLGRLIEEMIVVKRHLFFLVKHLISPILIISK